MTKKLHVVSPNAKILRAKCIALSPRELRLNETQEIIEEMMDFVYGTNNKGPERDRSHSMTVGLSANQVNLNRCISIVDMAVGRKNISDIQVLINPEIIWKSNTMVEHIEGCVNLENIWGPVMRSRKIKVKALDRNGNELLLTLQGWPAILLQHEVDHLNGILFIDRLADPKKAFHVEADDYAAYRKDKKNWKKFIDVSQYVRKI